MLKQKNKKQTKVDVWFYVLFCLDTRDSPSDLQVYSICNSLPLLIPNSQSFPPQLPPCLATTNLFSVPVSLFLFHKYADLCHSLDSKYKWYHMFFYYLIAIFFKNMHCLWHYRKEKILYFKSHYPLQPHLFSSLRLQTKLKKKYQIQRKSNH